MLEDDHRGTWFHYTSPRPKLLIFFVRGVNYLIVEGLSIISRMQCDCSGSRLSCDQG
ncbi:hypothetical protein Fmac_015412 [Flemingia macrophylla]|uniref:Uncharacterized protein n=1 Tax=Flemingia macrophylla TaxID=520843 RepID=A0ABD1MEH3_9FABA